MGRFILNATQLWCCDVEKLCQLWVALCSNSLIIKKNMPHGATETSMKGVSERSFQRKKMEQINLKQAQWVIRDTLSSQCL